MRTHRIVVARERLVQRPRVLADERGDDDAELDVGELLADAAVRKKSVPVSASLRRRKDSETARLPMPSRAERKVCTRRRESAVVKTSGSRTT
jgi:hypothetical protein